MPWVRIDDHFDEHPKFARAGPLGMALWVTGLAYCNRNLTDGFIPWAVAHRLMTWEYLGPAEDRGRKVYKIGVACGMSGEDVDCELVIGLLLDAKLWEEVDGGYRVHDYPEYQPTRDEVEAERAKKQAAGQAGGRASAQARASAGAQANGVADASAESEQVLDESFNGFAAGAQAKSKPVPVPGPVPNSVPGPVPPPPAAAGGPPAKFSDDERDLIFEVKATLEPFGLALRPEFWRKVLDAYGELPLGMEAHKQADWLRRNHKRIASATRYTNWLDKAMQDHQARAPALVEDEWHWSCRQCGSTTATIQRGDLCGTCYDAKKAGVA